MNSKLKPFIVASLAVVSSMVSLPSSAFAAGHITVGSNWAQNGGTATVIPNSAFAAHLEAGRSYACTAIGQATGSELAFNSTVTGPSGSNPDTFFRGGVTPVVTVTGSDSANDNRLAVHPTATGIHIFKLADAKTSGEQARLECVETTLYSAFNTNVNDFNFLELTNITNSSVEIQWTAIVFDGSTASGSTLVPANRRVDLDIHSIIGASRFGHVIVKHDGPFGAIRGAVSQYFGSVSDFRLSVSIPLETRENTL